MGPHGLLSCECVEKGAAVDGEMGTHQGGHAFSEGTNTLIRARDEMEKNENIPGSGKIVHDPMRAVDRGDGEVIQFPVHPFPFNAGVEK